MYEEPNVTSVAFNIEHDDLLVFTTHDTLAVRHGTNNPTRQRLSTLVIAFKDTTIHCLAKQQLHQTEVSIVGSVEQLLAARKWQEAYQLACLGVTKDTWDAVGHAALLALDLDVARRAFVRTQIHRLRIAKQSAVPEGVLIGQVLAHQVRRRNSSFVLSAVMILVQADTQVLVILMRLVSMKIVSPRGDTVIAPSQGMRAPATWIRTWAQVDTEICPRERLGGWTDIASKQQPAYITECRPMLELAFCCCTTRRPCAIAVSVL
jgi:hypothetical protein